MLDNRKVITIIGAAGSGKRMGSKLPKQFLKIGGQTILEKTVNAFAQCGLVDKVIIVTSKDYVTTCQVLFDELISEGRLSVVTGGTERQDSIKAGLAAAAKIAEDNSIILIQDGVRPYATKQLIERVCFAVIESGAVIPAIPSKDTIRHIEDGTLDRSKLVCVQTPQGFSFELIARAFEQAEKDGFYGTDDASLVERLGHKVRIVDGLTGNIKITTPEDLEVEMRIGTGFDVHCLVEDRKLILGGVDLPYEKGLLGHSDADVLIHALMDALLGAAALGDIGKLFPDNDDKYKGISSLKLLGYVTERLAEEGYSLGNADVTVICQKPKLAGHIPEMRENIAKVMGVDVNKISIKATTTEKLGFTGRGEGIAAEAVCILNR